MPGHLRDESNTATLQCGEMVATVRCGSASTSATTRTLGGRVSNTVRRKIDSICGEFGESDAKIDDESKSRFGNDKSQCDKAQ